MRPSKDSVEAAQALWKSIKDGDDWDYDAFARVAAVAIEQARLEGWKDCVNSIRPWWPKMHECDDFDGLWIWEGSPEFDGCSCFPKESPARSSKPAELLVEKCFECGGDCGIICNGTGSPDDVGGGER